MTVEEGRAYVRKVMRCSYIHDRTATEEKEDSLPLVPTRARKDTKKVKKTKVRAVRIDFSGEKFVICVEGIRRKFRRWRLAVCVLGDGFG